MVSTRSRGETFRYIRDQFRACGIESAALDARVLVCHALALSPEALVCRPETLVSAQAQAYLATLVARRRKREPIARIVGSKEFWGLDFTVNAHTLVPRPDSETVVRGVLGTVATRSRSKTRPAAYSILDIGTGSGCLMLALLSELPHASGVACDLCPRALATARQNAVRLGFAARCRFVVSDWLTEIEGVFDIIVCNPPYIRTADIQALEADVRDYDPVLALDGGDDALDAFRQLATQLPQYCHSDTILCFEIGDQQISPVTQIVNENGFTMTRHFHDLRGQVRALCVKSTVTP